MQIHTRLSRRMQRCTQHSPTSVYETIGAVHFEVTQLRRELATSLTNTTGLCQWKSAKYLQSYNRFCSWYLTGKIKPTLESTLWESTRKPEIRKRSIKTFCRKLERVQQIRFWSTRRSSDWQLTGFFLEKIQGWLHTPLNKLDARAWNDYQDQQALLRLCQA